MRRVPPASLPDIIVRFDAQPAVDGRRRGSPRCPTWPATRCAASSRTRRDRVRRAQRAATRSPRWSTAGPPPRLRGRRRARPARPGPRGAARARRSPQAWGIQLGDTVRLRASGRSGSSGSSRRPTTSAIRSPSRASTSRGRRSTRASAANDDPQVNLAEIWLRNPRYLNEVLVQARATSFGLHDIRFATRSGVRVLLDQAAGIVIDLLVALSLIALVTAGVMLAASARAEVQRRLGAIGVRRAIGASRGPGRRSRRRSRRCWSPCRRHRVGLRGGRAGHVRARRRGCSTLLNEPAPGGALVAAAARRLAGRRRDPGARRGVAGVAGRAAARSSRLLRGGDVSRTGARGRRSVPRVGRAGLRRARGAAGAARGAPGSWRPRSRSGSRPRSCC